MTGVPLTPGRRAQLAALLANEDGVLSRQYPQVASYLSDTEHLPPGGADPERAALFDLALLHHMTGSNSPNPYWAIVADQVTTATDGQRQIDGDRTRLHLAQMLLQAAYAYAVPSPETLRWVSAMTDGRPVIEIGAGRGYWASQLALAGIDISAYDADPPGNHDGNKWFGPIGGLPHQWHEVNELRELVAPTRAARRSARPAGHVLFLCWPPSWGHPMAHNALTAYERLGGDRLIYIGDDGARCGDERFFARLSSRWTLADRDNDYVRWWNLTDQARCWVR